MFAEGKLSAYTDTRRSTRMAVSKVEIMGLLRRVARSAVALALAGFFIYRVIGYGIDTFEC